MTPTTQDQFLAALRACGLLPVEQLERLEATVIAGGRAPSTAEAWARALTAERVLTEYQAEQLLAGRGAALVLGQYRILDRVGAGGMGQVFKAEHTLMKRRVALKVIALREPHSDPAVMEQFHREIQAAACLCHPNIVTAYDAAEAQGLHFLVMEYVAGIDLGRLVAKVGPLPVPLVCEFMRQVALGLQYAHERGLVHRDIKPSNLLIAQGSESASDQPQTTVVKILDLGLACLMGQPRRRAADGASELPAQEAAGCGLYSDPGSGLAGTPDYMAPEVAQDCRAAHVGSDLYSLGCTFYFALTGQVPYPGGSWTEKLLRHRFDPATPLRDLRPDIPPEIQAMVQRLMAKDPAERYPTPGVVAMLLKDWLAVHADRASNQHIALPPLPELIGGPISTPCAADSPTWSGREADPRQHADLAAPSHHAENLPRRRRQSLYYSGGLLAALAAGLLTAGLVRQPAPVVRWWNTKVAKWWRKSAEQTDSPAAAPRGSETLAVPSLPRSVVAVSPADLAPVLRAFTIEGLPGNFDTLTAAVQAARDGDSILIHGNGPFLTSALNWRGKALTFKAAPGYRPCLQLWTPSEKPSWQALLATDRSLAVEGIDLCRPSPGSGNARPETAHLIYCSGAALRLTDCHLLAHHGSAAIVCRQCPQVRISGCQVSAGTLALCVEVGDNLSADIHLAGNTFDLSSPGSAALSVWASEAGRPTALQFQLDRNTVRAGRVLALTALPGRVEVVAHDNDFAFRDALLSFAAFAEGDAWRRCSSWRGERNTYRGGQGSWLSVEGGSVAVSDLEGWRLLWGMPETGSSSAAGGP